MKLLCIGEVLLDVGELADKVIAGALDVGMKLIAAAGKIAVTSLHLFYS